MARMRNIPNSLSKPLKRIQAHFDEEFGEVLALPPL
jgi:hypothetical protein